MKNLFVLHTQYNIITGLAVLNKYHTNDENILLLIAEFKIDDHYLTKLKRLFSEVIVVQENFSNVKAHKRVQDFNAKISKCKNVLNDRFDKVIICQENYLDMLIVTKHAHKADISCYSVEEDAYFSWKQDSEISLKSRAISSVYNSVLTILHGRNKCYEKVCCYGMNRNIKRSYLMFPQCARAEIKSKELIELEATNIRKSISLLYPEKIDTVKGKSVVFFFDLINRYSDKHKIEQLVKELFEFSKYNNYNLICKYHPREMDKFRFLDNESNVIQIDSIIPAEKLVNELDNTQTVIIGNATTAIQVARKLGFDVVSIVNLNENTNHKMISAFEQMGILLPSNIEETLNYINNTINKGENYENNRSNSR